MRNRLMCYLSFNIIVYLICSIYFFTDILEDPEFTDIIENVTVPAGRNIKLGCSVKNLGTYKVNLIHHCAITVIIFYFRTYAYDPTCHCQNLNQY